MKVDTHILVPQCPPTPTLHYGSEAPPCGYQSWFYEYWTTLGELLKPSGLSFVTMKEAHTVAPAWSCAGG